MPEHLQGWRAPQVDVIWGRLFLTQPVFLLLLQNALRSKGASLVLPSSDRPLFYKSVAPSVFSKLTFYPRVDPNLFEMLIETLEKLL